MKVQRKDRRKPREITCIQCNEIFIRNISDVKFNNNEIPRFCSKKCSGAHQGLKNKGENNGMYGKKSWCNGLTKESDDRILLISEKKSGGNHHYYGKQLSSEHRNKISKKVKGENNGMFGKTHTLETKKLISENLKGIHSKEWFINKYGKNKGLELYEERCNNISKNNAFRKYNINNKNNYSLKSQEIFWKIYEHIKDRYSNIYFAELNNEYSCNTGLYNYDFVINDIKLVIEFNGCKFHPKEGDLNWTSPYGISYNEQRNKDIDKLLRAKENGYKIFYIWEDDNYEDKINEFLNLI
jgi:very-short-patch-repair endonuclease